MSAERSPLFILFEFCGIRPGAALIFAFLGESLSGLTFAATGTKVLNRSSKSNGRPESALISAVMAAVCLSGSMLLRAAPLDWQNGNGFRAASLPVPSSGKSGFELLPPQATGIRFTNHLSHDAIASNRILENGSGVALGDVDGDGWCDVYFCRLEGPNVLYRNLGNWMFQDITAAAGVACAEQFSTGALLADVEGDGDLDLLVNSASGGTRLFLNDGAARFAESKQAGLAPKFCGTTMTMADIDGDGDLELYVANYRTNTFKDGIPGLKVESKIVDGKVILTPEDRFAAVVTKNGGIRMREIGEPDILYVNKGQGRFGPVSWVGGAFADEQGRPLTEVPRDWGLAAMFRDVNGDRTPDLYVCNDFFYSLDRLWINERSQRFRDIEPTAFRRMSMSSMAVDFADINRDGFDDFFVADMLSRDHEARHRQRANVGMMRDVPLPLTDPNFRPEVIQNTLHVNRGDGTYAEIAHFAEVAASEWTWSAAFMDVDLDGFEDLLITNGNEHDVLDADMLRETAKPGKSAEEHSADLKKFPRINAPNLAFRNRGDLTFREMGAEWGFNTRGVSHGMALADLDNDGDLDVVVNNLNSAAGIYRNLSAAPRIAVRLKGQPANTRGIGARIKMSGGAVPQSQEMICGGRYLSCDDALRVFAGFSTTNEFTIEVLWRSGTRSVIEHARANQVYEVHESAARAAPDATAPATTAAWFTDASDLLRHQHQENGFDDFQRQPLLPAGLSRLGPGVSWFDLNGDGWDDLIIGGGKGALLAIYQNDGRGGFNRVNEPPFNQLLPQDVTGLVAWKDAQGTARILAAMATYEETPGTLGVMRHYDFTARSVENVPSGLASSLGPVALADIDGDGDLDLFAGGRVMGGRWPEPADSRIYRWEGDRFEVDAAKSQALQKVGLVSGAVWSDLDANGTPELILACHWGPIRVFRIADGRLREATAELGLDPFTGWWNSVTTADLDGDGKLDIVAGNWGLNSPYRASPARPARLFFGDVLGRGMVDVFETEYDASGAVAPLRPLDIVAAAIPPLRDRFATHRAFAKITIDELLAPHKTSVRQLQAATLASMIFLNRPGRFASVELPSEAQWAPVFGVNAADFDGDGAEDIFVSQNFFDTQLELPRLDAGRGLLLRNDGKGHLAAVPGDRSGIKLYGEQRGAAVADFNQDGRVDLVITQNAGPTRLFANSVAKRGLRVWVEGPPANPHAIGATLRVQMGARLGPAREIRAGSGYWSQDSPVQVLASPEPPSHVFIRWPGGQEQRIPVPADTRQIRIRFKGAEG